MSELLPRLRTLLYDTSPDQVAQGLELVHALGDPEIAAALLSHDLPTDDRTTGPWWGLRLALLDLLPDEHPHPWVAWRRTAEELKIHREAPVTLPLGLVRFPALHKLWLHGDSLRQPFPQRPLPELRVLMLVRGRPRALYSPHLPALERIVFFGSELQDPGPLPETLQSLTTNRWTHDTLPAQWLQLPALNRLFLGSRHPTALTLPAGPAWAGLDSLTLRRISLTDPRPLEGCASLTRLVLDSLGPQPLPADLLARNPALTHLTLRQVDGLLGDPLPALPQLKELCWSHRAVRRLPSLAHLGALEKLEILQSPIERLPALPAQLPHLKVEQCRALDWSTARLPHGLKRLEMQGSLLPETFPAALLQHPTLESINALRCTFSALPMPPRPGPRLRWLALGDNPALPKAQRDAWVQALRAARMADVEARRQAADAPVADAPAAQAQAAQAQASQAQASHAQASHAQAAQAQAGPSSPASDAAQT